MTGHYEPLLVTLSIVIAIAASFVALDLAARMTAALGRTTARYWLAGGAISMGTGVWSMHFIGMLAFSLPIPIAHDIPITVASWFTAVIASAIALHTVGRPSLSATRLASAGILMGAGIVVMHYLGMEAMRLQPRISYDGMTVALSAGIAVLASTVAMWLAFRLRMSSFSGGFPRRAAAAVLMGIAITGMHYTGMHAASFATGTLCIAKARSFDSTWMAWIIAAVTLLFLCTTLLISLFVAVKPTIRSRLAFLVVGCMLPVSLLALGFVIFNFHQNQDTQKDQVLGTVRALSATFEKDLASVESGLLVLATSPYLPQHNYQMFYNRARDVLSDLHANAITLTAAGNQQLIDTRRPYGEALPLSDNPEQWSRLLATGKTVLSDLFFSRLDGQPVITIAVPVKHEGVITHQISGTIFPSRLSKIIAEQHFPPSWIVVVFDSTGTVVARSHEQSRFIGKKGAPRLLDQLTIQDEGSIQVATLEGIHVTSMFSRSKQSKWTVAIGIPTETMNAGLVDSLLWLLAMLAVLLATSLGLAWLIARSIAQSIHALTEPAHALGMGLPIAVPALGLAEADEVGKALARAAAILALSEHAAQHDVLTGLANRLLFNESTRQQMTVAKRTRGNLAVLYIDLDGFKTVNDTHGHDVGDALLKAVAARIQVQIRECDIAARLGGDEFAVLLLQPGDKGVERIAGKLVACLSVPFPIGASTLHISASIGAAVFPESGGSLEELLRNADLSMYLAKKQGKSRYVIAAHA